ncbi:monooxygenase [Penicillium malachiteum]|uniref:Monooxygenase n=1 Tax=Penicillium malachiteum TaxID=1324776 RepID=A0AAD6HLJ4_9EURO|nr:monooxygenase [Penicillium malachiteum]
MSPLRPCKVIISGGGVAGLALAVALDKIGVDYQLLEAYPDIAPKLGFYEELKSICPPLSNFGFRGPNGELLSSSDNNWDPVSLCKDSDKSKVLTGKRIKSIENTEDGALVTTTDGSVFFGDMVIGTDGVHSSVRKAIVRHAKERGLGPEYTEEDKVSSDFACIYGVSPKLEGLPENCLEFRFNRGSSTLIGNGPPDRTFYEIPQLSEDDLEKVVKEHWDEYVTSDMQLSKFYETRTEALYTSMHEFVFSKWHLDRMLILGDAAHQMTSILAQGGAQAVESIACFANALTRVLSNKSKTGRLSAREIQEMFEQIQGVRHSRVKSMVESSNKRQLRDAMVTPELEDLTLNKFPKLVPGIILERWDETFKSAVLLDMIPVPEALNASWLYRQSHETETNILRSSL